LTHVIADFRALTSLFWSLAAFAESAAGILFNSTEVETSMPIPAYLWLKDDGGSDIRGSVTVQGREGSIEVIGFGHGLNLPVDSNTGKITGSRSHSPMSIEEEFDAAVPICTRPWRKGRP
jgi:hypothetical protein